MRVGIIGCGLIGGKRALALGSDVLTTCHDSIEHVCRDFAYEDFGGVPCMDLHTMWQYVDAVIISTPNANLVPYAILAISYGKHVLIEKPGARSVAEIQRVIAHAAHSAVTVRVGYNLRFHPAILKAKALLGEEEILRMEGFYGHGGGITGWRKEEGTSVELDLGSHLADLVQYFGGLRCVERANLGMAVNEWEPRFEFRITTPTKQLYMKGLGGAYGPESLTVIPATKGATRLTYSFTGEDRSWHEEWTDFLMACNGHPGRGATLQDATNVLKVVT